MKVLIVNKFYYSRGGDCVCTLNLEKLLREQGHEVAVYAMQYPQNIDSPWSRYFAPEVKFGGSPVNLLRAAARTMGYGDINGSFKKILHDFNPDVVHLNNIHSYLSPRLAQLARRHGAKVVWTLHDYKLLCPGYSCLRDGKPCEECFTSKKPVLTHRCMKGSLPASAIAWMEALKWNRKSLERAVDTFICPSGFMNEAMKRGGFDPAKLVTICNFVDPVKLASLPSPEEVGSRERHGYCYIGRLSREKGVDTLLEAASTLPHDLYIAGDGPLGPELRAKYGSLPHIHFLGHLQAKEVAELLLNSRFSIIASECNENNPLGVIESLCAGTPVVGTNMGGIPELIDPDTGIIAPAGDAKALAKAIDEAANRQWDNEAIARKSRERFSSATHYKQLIEIY